MLTIGFAARQALYLFSPLLFAALLAGGVLRFNWFGRLARPIRPSALLLVTSFVVVLGLHPLIALTGYVIGARATAR